jgi:phosphoglycolate phosphatase (TIGR01487 family)
MMTTAIRLLALDLDGTTLDEKKCISNENVAWIRKAKEAGIAVIFATGRDYNQVRPFQEQLGFDAPMVLVNGSEVRDDRGEILEQHFIKETHLKDGWKLAQEQEVMFGGYTTNGWHQPSESSWDWLSFDWMKCGFRSDDPNLLKRVESILKTWEGVEIAFSQWNVVELNPKGVSKASGVQRVCRLLGIEMSQVMAIGDSLNDYKLFQRAGLSVAMANAADPLKKIADQLTASNREDGVAKAIQEVFF